MLAQQNPNCTDFELCFQKRLGTAGDTIIDVLLINPPDSIVGANFEVRMSAEAYGGQVFDVHSAFAAAGYSPSYIDNTFQDDVITFQRSGHLPILLSEDTVKLFSFTILAPAGVCIDLRFVDFARAPAEIALFDASGQTVARRSLRLESGPNRILLEGLGSLPPGFYAIRLVAEGGERWHGKAIKF
jgi:hypothetical protein